MKQSKALERAKLEPILSDFLLDKTIGIVIVEPTMAIAGTIRRVLLENGYSNIFIAHSVLDAFNTLGNNSIGWMFVSPLSDEKLNQWHCLRLPLEVQTYSNIMISVLVNADSGINYEDYYAFGALSIHSRQLTYNSFNDELLELMKRLKSSQTVGQAIAIDVRGRLEKKGNTQLLEDFEISVSQKIDDTLAQRIRVIEARLKNSSRLEAMLDMRQTVHDFPESAGSIKNLAQKYLGTSDIQSFKGKFPLSAVLILDPDTSQQQFLRTVLTEMGAETIVCCETLDEACEALHVGQVFDLVVTEWKIHKVEGHAFIQHVRQHGHESTPVIVHSSLVKPEDKPLIEEIRGVFIINKPSPVKQFKLSLTDALERWNFPQESVDQEDKIVNSSKAGNLEQAKMLNAVFQALPKVEQRRKDYLTAVIAFHEGRFQEARDIILINSRKGTPSSKEISLLGKILLRLGDHATALKCLEQANQMVPGNIERMCNLADASAEVGKPERAMQIASEARKIGGDIGMVQNVYAKHAVANGLLAEASEYLDSESTAREMISFMNNLGIAHAASQKWAESEESYQNALKALDGRHPHLGALVAYNLGLSLVKQNRLPESLVQLKAAEAQGEVMIKRKASDLRERCEKAIAKKEPIILKEAIREIVSGRAALPQSEMEVYEERAKVQNHGLFRVIAAEFKTPGMDLSTELPKNILRKDKGPE
jgi:DNA-binding response OmpR family regulator